MHDLHRRPLGTSPFRVAPIALGCNVFGWTADAATSHSILDAFVDDGFNLVDTADMYSIWVPGHQGGESETILGQWFAKSPSKRDQVVLATKVGMALGEKRKGLSARWIKEAVDDSLRRLGTDRIDLYQAHQDDPDTPMQETLEAFDGLIRAGKVRAIGASNFSAARLQEALSISEREGLPRYVSLQPHYNLVERKVFEAELEAVCVRNELAVINYFGLARGFLTGKYRRESDLTQSVRGAGVKGYMNEQGFAVLDALSAVARECDASMAQVALAWQIARPSITAPIASVTSVAQWRDLAAAARVQLTASHIQHLDTASAWSSAA